MLNFKGALRELYLDAKEKYNIKKAPKVILRQDENNAKKMFGRTAFYSPSERKIVLFITNRHPKDILRSFCHEMIHHVQHERGDLEMGDASDPKYAQEDKHMRRMEMEAYLKGNMLLRDFEDNFKYE